MLEEKQLLRRIRAFIWLSSREATSTIAFLLLLPFFGTMVGIWAESKNRLLWLLVPGLWFSWVLLQLRISTRRGSFLMNLIKEVKEEDDFWAILKKFDERRPLELFLLLSVVLSPAHLWVVLLNHRDLTRLKELYRERSSNVDDDEPLPFQY